MSAPIRASGALSAGVPSSGAERKEEEMVRSRRRFHAVLRAQSHHRTRERHTEGAHLKATALAWEQESMRAVMNKIRRGTLSARV